MKSTPDGAASGTGASFAGSLRSGEGSGLQANGLGGRRCNRNGCIAPFISAASSAAGVLLPGGSGSRETGRGRKLQAQPGASPARSATAKASRGNGASLRPPGRLSGAFPGPTRATGNDTGSMARGNSGCTGAGAATPGAPGMPIRTARPGSSMTGARPASHVLAGEGNSAGNAGRGGSGSKPPQGSCRCGLGVRWVGTMILRRGGRGGSMRQEARTLAAGAGPGNGKSHAAAEGSNSLPGGATERLSSAASNSSRLPPHARSGGGMASSGSPATGALPAHSLGSTGGSAEAAASSASRRALNGSCTSASGGPGASRRVRKFPSRRPGQSPPAGAGNPAPSPARSLARQPGRSQLPWSLLRHPENRCEALLHLLAVKLRVLLRAIPVAPHHAVQQRQPPPAVCTGMHPAFENLSPHLSAGSGKTLMPARRDSWRRSGRSRTKCARPCPPP
jgi:hypothetical protein